MPEGDTVWLAAQRLDAALGGHQIVRSDLRVPSLATVDLRGSTVADVVSRGKHLLFRFVDGPGAGWTLHTHFRMDGTWHLYGPDDVRTGGADHQIRVVLEVAGTTAVGYRLPVVELVRTTSESDVVGHLGPDLLDPHVDLAEAVTRLESDSARPLGDALLDQRLVAGIGNLYRAETCFLAGVTPFVPIGELGSYGVESRSVLVIARRLLSVNAGRSVQATTGYSRRDSWHWVFERRSCLRCATPVSTALTGVAPMARVAYWCPSCQRGPSPESVPIRRLLPPTIGRTRYRP